MRRTDPPAVKDIKTKSPVTEMQVALLRGINVGRAKRVAMADLRALFTSLGYADVRTLLNSGNVIFTAPKAIQGDAPARIEKAMAAKLGVSARVILLAAAEVAVAVRGNPLARIADDPSRLLFAVLAKPEDRERLKPLVQQEWDPDLLVIGKRVAYLWCPNGNDQEPVGNRRQPHSW